MQQAIQKSTYESKLARSMEKGKEWKWMKNRGCIHKQNSMLELTCNDYKNKLGTLKQQQKL